MERANEARGASAVGVALASMAAAYGCGGVESYVKDGYTLDKDHSVFTRYSGSYCKLAAGEADADQVDTSCDNLRRFLDPEDAACRGAGNAPFTPSVGYFPERPRPMKLC